MFDLLHTDPSSKARVGVLTTRHGQIQTPVFMPVGTQGSVKAVSPDELIALGAEIVLGNTYHLDIRPGSRLIENLGGLHRFMAWPRSILTDSGGFQVFSLARLRKITEDGVRFQNHLDGAPCFLSPEEAMDIQMRLGSDIAMVFDECPPYPCERDYAEQSLQRTLRWAVRCQTRLADVSPDKRPLAFGIVQGAVWEDLRRESAQALATMGWDGYAVGGVSVGEPEEEMFKAVESSEPWLPAHRPRYAMGLGTPPQLVEMVARGIDMFDCVLPTRLARNGTAFTAHGTLNLKNRPFAEDPGPIEENCQCPACSTFSRAYIRHMLKSEEILGLRLISLHNLYFYLNLMRRTRRAIVEGTFAEFRKAFVETYRNRISHD